MTIHYLKKLCDLSPKNTQLQQEICNLVNMISNSKLHFSFPDEWCDLTHLICTTFGITDLQEYIASKEYCNKPELCTDIGKKLSSSLVRIASTRIFSNPEQSILELPVNSLDAYNPSSNVGKFGMGFFSILYWLVGHPKRQLIIESCYLSEKGLEKFRCILKYSEDQKFLFKLDSQYQRDTTGTKIILDCQNDKFTEHNIEQFTKQLEKLKYTSSASLLVRDNTSTDYKLYNDSDSQKTINLQYNEDGISVCDYATGIPLEVLLVKLFTPSISTKTIQIAEQKSTTVFENGSKILRSDNNKFLILVNKVAVVDIPFSTEIENKYTILLDLPHTTRVPVSRDDIIINKNTISSIHESLNIIIDTFTRQYQSIYPIQKAIDAYTTYTVNTMNKELFKNVWSLFEAQLYNQYIFVSYKYIYIFSKINLQMPYLVASKSNVVLIEKQLDKIQSYRVFTGKKVLYLDHVENNSTSAGTLSYIFVDINYTKDNPNWPSYLSLTNLTDLLIPIVSVSKTDNSVLTTLFPKEREQIEQERANVAKTIRNSTDKAKYIETINTFILKFIKLKSRYDFSAKNDNSDIPYYFSNYNFCFKFLYHTVGLQLSVLYLNLLTENLGLLKPILSYGNEKPKFYAYVSSIMKTYSSYNYKTIKVTPNLLKMTEQFIKYITELDKKEHVFIEPASFCPIYIVSSTSANISMRHKDITSISRIMSLIAEITDDFYEFSLIFNLLQLIYSNENSDKISLIMNLSNDKIKELGISILNITKMNYGNIQSLFPIPAQHYSLDVKIDSDKTFIYFLIDPVLLNSLQTSLILKLNELSFAVELPSIDYETFNIRYHYKFTESQLIQSALTHNFTTINQLFSNAVNTTTKNRLQITEIAVNEGSTKTAINAVVTETVQNSLDAIRSSSISNESIKIYLKQTGNDVVFTIEDYVGINDKGIVATMIPFLSSKTPSEIVTGEMGSGFFNIYRDSSIVHIKTIKDGKMTTIYDTPIIQKDRVVDIDRLVSIEQTQESNKTTIQALYKFSDTDKMNDTISNFLNMVRNTIGFIKTSNIQLNGEDISIPTISLLETEYFELRVKDKQSLDLQSYIFTKDVPFTPLVSYFIDKKLVQDFIIHSLGRNCILNIKHGVFTPVQTRGSLNISPENLRLLQNFIYDSCYLNMIYYMLNNQVVEYFNEILPNFTSKSSLNQLLFSAQRDPLKATKLSLFMVHYSFDNQPSIQVLIDEASRILKDSILLYKEQEVRSRLQSLTNNKDVIAVVLLWLNEKNSSRNSRTEDKQDKPKQEQNMEVKQIEDIYNNFITNYWIQGRNLGIQGFEQEIPKCFVRKLENNVRGFYKPADHSLYFNYLFMNEVNNFLMTFRTKNLFLLSQTDIYNSMFSMSLPSSTVIHELEHARRNNSHDALGSHDDITIQFPGLDEETYTFYESANKVYDLIARNTSLYTDWMA